MSKLSPAARCRSPRLRLQRIHGKIASVDAEIALIGDSHNPKLSLFEQEHPGLEPLRAKVDVGVEEAERALRRRGKRVEGRLFLLRRVQFDKIS